METGKEKGKLEGHTADVSCVAISPDGKIIISGSADQTIR
jgi:WD40 repeat protein